jgi:hypothetical protein
MWRVIEVWILEYRKRDGGGWTPMRGSSYTFYDKNTAMEDLEWRDKFYSRQDVEYRIKQYVPKEES